jgi:3-methyladenine DNA glycosylase AlkD
MKRIAKRSRSHAALIRAARKALRKAGDPAKASMMQAYMKSAMPYFGIQAHTLEKLARAIFAKHPMENIESWRDTVLELWRDARYREERYLAIKLAGHPAYGNFRTLDALPMYEEMITNGAWWDYVDSIAKQRLGELLRLYPREMRAVLRKWAKSDDIWKRRSAILAQLGFKNAIDLPLLYDCIQPSIDNKEFFLRKAIGWALRQYDKTDADEVRRYVAEHKTRLSPLSQREALKNISLDVRTRSAAGK